jgi:hypothetical protein
VRSRRAAGGWDAGRAAPRGAHRRVAACALTVLLAGGCGLAGRYPRRYEEQFLVACGAGAEKSGASIDQAVAYCTCMLASAERLFPYTQFLHLAARLGSPGYRPPASFVRAHQACVRAEPSS